jgi:ketosteroid isomerase-like protein
MRCDSSITASWRPSSRGDPEPELRLWSRRDDITLTNPLGPPVRGWEAVREAAEHALSQVADGEAFSVESISTYTTTNLAYELHIERCVAKVGGADEAAPVSLRVTTVYRRENHGWEIVHRHIDPTTGERPVESITRL